MKNFWKKWLTFSKKIVSIQASIILMLFYLIVIIPLSIFLKTFFKNALLGHRYVKRSNTYWIRRKKVQHDLHFAHEQ